MAYVYPYKKHNYIVLIDSKEVGGFSEVNAGDITIDPIEYREGIHPVNTVLKQPGLVKYGNVTLKWGLATATELMTWLQSTVDGTCERKTITIQLCDDLHNGKLLMHGQPSTHQLILMQQVMKLRLKV